MDNLFSNIDPEFSVKPRKEAIFMGDGGSRGNPGIAGAGFVLYELDGETEIARGGEYCGDDKTNNHAEYRSLIIGAQKASDLGVTHLKVFMDSKLAIEQMKGAWKVKHPQIKILFQAAKAVCENFEQIEFAHVRREKNMVADSIANEFMDRRG